MLNFPLFNIDVQIFVHVALSSLVKTNTFVILQEVLGKIKKSNGQGVTRMGGKSSEQSKKSHNQFRLRIFSFKDKTGDILDLWGKCHKRPFCCIEI